MKLYWRRLFDFQRRQSAGNGLASFKALCPMDFLILKQKEILAISA